MAPDLQRPVERSPHGATAGGGHGWAGGSSSRSSFFGGDSSSGRSPSGASSDAGSGGVTRGGFGSFAHAFGFSVGGCRNRPVPHDNRERIAFACPICFQAREISIISEQAV